MVLYLEKTWCLLVKVGFRRTAAWKLWESSARLSEIWQKVVTPDVDRCGS